MTHERKSSEPHREQTPGELEHASGDVDQVEAAIVSGAAGLPYEEADEAGLEAEALRYAPRTAPAPTGGSGPAFLQFLRASWAELQRVQWPNRQQVFQATAVVIGFVIVAGAFLGVADYVAGKIIDVIL